MLRIESKFTARAAAIIAWMVPAMTADRTRAEGDFFFKFIKDEVRLMLKAY